MGIKGIILSQLIGSALVFVVILPMMIRGMNFIFDKKLFNGMFKYGFPLIFSGISMLLLSMGDRFLLKYFLTYSEVGIYSMAYKIAGLINMLLIQSFQLGFLPIAFKMYDKPNSKRYFSKVLTYYTFILIIVSLAVSVYAKEIMVLLSQRESYVIAYTVVPLIVLAFIFKGMQYVFSLGIHYAKKTHVNAVIISVLVVFNLGLNVLLIPWLNFYGAAVSAILSNFLMTLFFYFYSQKMYHIPFELNKVYLMFAIGFGLFGLGVWSNELNLIMSIVVKFFIILLFPVVLYFFNFYERVELQTAKGFYLKWRNPSKWKQNFTKKRH
jgi:O-antigen/teichoic acid export membrane protein